MLCCPSFGVVVVVVVGSNYLYLLKLKIFSFYLQHEGAKCDVLEPGSGTLGWGWCVVLAEHRTGPAIAPAPDQYCTRTGFCLDSEEAMLLDGVQEAECFVLLLPPAAF